MSVNVWNATTQRAEDVSGARQNIHHANNSNFNTVVANAQEDDFIINTSKSNKMYQKLNNVAEELSAKPDPESEISSDKVYVGNDTTTSVTEKLANVNGIVDDACEQWTVGHTYGSTVKYVFDGNAVWNYIGTSATVADATNRPSNGAQSSTYWEEVNISSLKSALTDLLNPDVIPKYFYSDTPVLNINFPIENKIHLFYLYLGVNPTQSSIIGLLGRQSSGGVNNFEISHQGTDVVITTGNNIATFTKNGGASGTVTVCGFAF